MFSLISSSSADGCAIAYAVSRYLAHKVGCLALFATHFHVLHNYFSCDKLVSSYHMQTQVTDQEVAYLYKFIKGPSEKSFGSAVAKLAGLPESVLAEAECIAAAMEQAITKSAHYRYDDQSAKDLYELLREQLKSHPITTFQPELTPELIEFEAQMTNQ